MAKVKEEKEPTGPSPEEQLIQIKALCARWREMQCVTGGSVGLMLASAIERIEKGLEP